MRARPSAPVATPLRWEYDLGLRPDSCTSATIGDPWQAFGRHGAACPRLRPLTRRDPDWLLRLELPRLGGDLHPDGVPAKRWLGIYAERFDTVEVNTTFYRLPARATVQRRVQQTPDGFAFTVKASRYLTDVKRLQTVPDGVARLYERIEPLLNAGRLACVLWQLPANFHRDDARVAAALGALPDGRHAFEFRHPSWFADDVLGLLADRAVALMVTTPAANSPSEPSPASWAFVRLHYGHRGRDGN